MNVDPSRPRNAMPASIHRGRGPSPAVLPPRYRAVPIANGTARRSGMDQLDVAPGHLRQPFEIVTVDGHDLVPVDSEQHDASIDDVSEPRGAKEPASGPTKRLIERADIDSAKHL